MDRSAISATAAAATAASLNDPTSVAVDAHGDLFIADSANNVVREVTSNGIITTVAGTGTAGYSGDNGAATSAEAERPDRCRGRLVRRPVHRRLRQQRHPRGDSATESSRPSRERGRRATAAMAMPPRPPSSTIRPPSRSTRRAIYSSPTPATTSSARSPAGRSTRLWATAAMLNDPQGVAVGLLRQPVHCRLRK